MSVDELMSTKICTKCGLEKPHSAFTITDRKRGYLKGSCKSCESERVRKYYATNENYRTRTQARIRVYNAAHPRTPEQARRYALKSSYGLTVEQYDAMFAAQGKRCALCKSEDSGRKSGKWKNGHFHVDHCHETGRVRGLLCHKCNVRVGAYEGLMKDVGLNAVLNYLAPHLEKVA